MGIVDSVKSFLEQCPLIEKGRINVNYLGKRGGDLSIEAEPSETVIKSYVDGSSLRRFAFVVALRGYFDEDEVQNMNTARFFEELGRWMESCGRLPLLGQGLTAQSIEPVTEGYLYSADGVGARYQLRCRLIYRKEG